MRHVSPASPRPPPRRGFTLIEVLGVVVILGIVSAVVIPQMSGRDDQKAAAAARVVMADLTYAQSRAIATQRVHYVRFDPAGKTYAILDAWSPANVITHPVTGTNYQVYFGPTSTNDLTDMQLVSASLDGQPVLAFDGLGIPYSYAASTSTLTALTSGTIVVKSGTYQMTVTVAPFSGELTAN